MAWTLSVTELNEYVRKSLAGDPMLRDIKLRGELSGFKQYASGHWYFTLKDKDARIQCAMFRQSASRVKFVPRDGMRVVLTGTVGLYTQSGSYQFYTDQMAQDGVGELFLKLEELKAKLLAEGLFDAARKRPLPLLPRAIGIVTSKSGAVVHDIEMVTKRRNKSVQLILRPALVQGDGAAQDIAAGICELAALPQVDVIIVGRGGGSMEDLWAFNEEIVVRTIAACPVPVISAVGHETDTTLADYAADVRAATPSNAAELAVPEKDVLQSTVYELQRKLFLLGDTAILTRRQALMRRERRLQDMHPQNRLLDMQSTARLLTARLQEQMQKHLAALEKQTQLAFGKLNALGPMHQLSRGYAVVMAGDKPVTSVQDVSEKMTLLLQDGRVQVQTLHVEGGNPFA